MLILTRNHGQAVYIDCPNGDRITVVMMREGIHAKTREKMTRPAIGIDAPQSYHISRAELEGGYNGKID